MIDVNILTINEISIRKRRLVVAIEIGLLNCTSVSEYEGVLVQNVIYFEDKDTER